MKKYIALAIACAALAAGVSYLPAAVEASVPAAVSISPTEVYYSESVNTSGTLCYIGQGDVTSALPLVLSEFEVEEGDHVEVGDVIARVDRKASETFISSLGKVSQLAAATASLSTAMSLIPEEITADRSGTVISTAGAGAAVESGTSIATIAGTDSLVLTSAVSELNIARIQPGQPVEFTFALILMNMIPVLIVAVLVALGLKFIPEKMINGFQIFAKFLVALITLGLAAAVVKFHLGWELIPGLDPIFMAPGDKPGEVMRAIEVIGSISCVLLGAYPMVLLLTRWFEKPLMSVGKVLNMNNIAAAGMVATLANNIPMFGMMKQMDTRGKVINCAFAVSAAFALGDHLGFAAANMNAMIFPMIVGKLIGGVTAIGVAMMLVPKEDASAAKTEAEAQS